MPELPDVERRRRYLCATSLHKKIIRVELLAPDMLKGMGKGRFSQLLKGRVLDNVKRRAKYLIIRLDSPYSLILHLGMTGDLQYYKGKKIPPPFTRLLVHFQGNSHLAFQNARKLGKIFLTKVPYELPCIKQLGPEPLEDNFTFDVFRERIKNHKRAVKPLLLEQSFIAGIGNLYADEVLFQAGIRPTRRSNGLSQVELKRIFKNIKWVLDEANRVNAEVERLKNKFFIPNRGPDEVCFRCKTPLEHLRIGGRTTCYCARCQK